MSVCRIASEELSSSAFQSKKFAADNSQIIFFWARLSVNELEMGLFGNGFLGLKRASKKALPNATREQECFEGAAQVCRVTELQGPNSKA